jgi:hypothetical protein
MESKKNEADFYSWLIDQKKARGYTHKLISEVIGKSPEAFRTALTRKSLSDLEKKALEDFFKETDLKKFSNDPVEAAQYIVEHHEDLIKDVPLYKMFIENVILKALKNNEIPARLLKKLNTLEDKIKALQISQRNSIKAQAELDYEIRQLQKENIKRSSNS